MEWRNVDERRDCGVNYGMEMALGEHGGSGDVQVFDKEGKEVEWEEIRGRKNWNSNLNWAVEHSRSAGGQLSASRHVHFGQPTTNRVQFGSTSRSVFCDRESSVSCRPTDRHNLGRPTANRVKFGSISRMVIFLSGDLAVSRQSAGG